MELLESKKQRIIDETLDINLKKLHRKYRSKGGKWDEEKFVRSLKSKSKEYLLEVDSVLIQEYNLSLENTYNLISEVPKAKLAKTFSEWNLYQT
jgi:hypothetical protein